jgi:hypothetical protein
MLPGTPTHEVILIAMFCSSLRSLLFVFRLHGVRPRLDHPFLFHILLYYMYGTNHAYADTDEWESCLPGAIQHCEDSV